MRMIAFAALLLGFGSMSAAAEHNLGDRHAAGGLAKRSA